MMNRAAAFNTIGEDTGFTVIDAPLPEPGPGEIRFEVAAFGLNQADLLLVAGRHYVGAALPIRLGYEGCGVVDAVGAGVTRWKVDDRVTVIPNVDGPYWTGNRYALACEEFATAWPEHWSAPEAAAFWMQALTPYYVFHDLFPIHPGEWVMVTAATGASGLGAVGMAKLAGARVIATTRSQSKVAALEEHGADVVLSTDQSDFVAAVASATDGAGVRLILDSLCGPYADLLAETLAPRGIMAVHGALGGADNALSLDVIKLVHRGAGVFGYSLINELRDPAKLMRGRDFCLAAVADGRMERPRIDGVFPLDQVAAAYERMRSGAQTGKIVVTMGGA